MAARGFGVSFLQIKCSDCGYATPKLATLLPSIGLGTTGNVRFDGLVVSRKSTKPLVVCRSSVSEADPKVEENSKHNDSSCDAVMRCFPNVDEIESLLTELCDTTSIAEVKLKIGGFQLYVSRNLANKSALSQPPVPAPVATQTAVETPDSNGSVASNSLALSKPIAPSGKVVTLLDKAAEENLAILKSPRVGYFRRSRTIKGKRTPPSCKEKDIVKEGQVLCYIDQLGGEIPVESDTSGEVVKIFREDGDPVGYGDALIAVLPSFPGIKKIQ